MVVFHRIEALYCYYYYTQRVFLCDCCVADRVVLSTITLKSNCVLCVFCYTTNIHSHILSRSSYLLRDTPRALLPPPHHPPSAGLSSLSLLLLLCVVFGHKLKPTQYMRAWPLLARLFQWTTIPTLLYTITRDFVFCFYLFTRSFSVCVLWFLLLVHHHLATSPSSAASGDIITPNRVLLSIIRRKRTRSSRTIHAKT